LIIDDRTDEPLDEKEEAWKGRNFSRFQLPAPATWV